LAGKILGMFKTRVKEFTLVPATGGCFEVQANGELIYSKLATGQFPDEFAVVDMVGERIKK
jgi:selenoprotein W-related protein